MPSILSWSSTGQAPAAASGLSGDIVVAGDSLTDLGFTVHHYLWGLSLTRNPPRLIYNAGVSGDTIQALINRFDTDVIAKAPAICMLRIGTNSTSLTQTQFETQYQQLLDSLATAGIFGIIHAVPPKASLGSTITGFNDWLQTQCEASPSTLHFVDDSAGIGDASYNAVDANYSDAPTDVHMNGLGVRTMGVAMSTILEGILTQTDPRITDGTDTYEQDTGSDQYVTNPLMTGTGGTKSGFTGTVPDDWSIQASGSGTGGTAEIVDADAEDANQTPWLRCNISTIGATNHSVTISTTLTHPAIADDDAVIRLDMVAEVRFVDLVCTNISKLTVKAQTGGGTVANKGETLNLAGLATINDHLVIRTSWAFDQGGVARVAYTANTIKFLLTASFTGADTGPVGAIDIRNVSVRGQTT